MSVNKQKTFRRYLGVLFIGLLFIAIVFGLVFCESINTQKLRLEFGYKEGDQLTYKMQVLGGGIAKKGNRVQDLELKYDLLFTERVTKVDSTGNIQIEITFDSVTGQTEVNSLTSALPETLRSALMHNATWLKITSNGSVESLKFPQDDPVLRLLKNSLLLIHTFDFPDKEIPIGDTWTAICKNVGIPQEGENITEIQEFVFTFAGYETYKGKNCANIEVNTVSKPSPTAEYETGTRPVGEGGVVYFDYIKGILLLEELEIFSGEPIPGVIEGSKVGMIIGTKLELVAQE